MLFIQPALELLVLLPASHLSLLCLLDELLELRDPCILGLSLQIPLRELSLQMRNLRCLCGTLLLKRLHVLAILSSHCSCRLHPESEVTYCSKHDGDLIVRCRWTGLRLGCGGRCLSGLFHTHLYGRAASAPCRLDGARVDWQAPGVLLFFVPVQDSEMMTRTIGSVRLV